MGTNEREAQGVVVGRPDPPEPEEPEEVREGAGRAQEHWGSYLGLMQQFRHGAAAGSM